MFEGNFEETPLRDFLRFSLRFLKFIGFVLLLFSPVVVEFIPLLWSVVVLVAVLEAGVVAAEVVAVVVAVAVVVTILSSLSLL